MTLKRADLPRGDNLLILVALVEWLMGRVLRRDEAADVVLGHRLIATKVPLSDTLQA